MKKDIHPADYRTVMFEDMSSGAVLLIGSTIHTKDTGTHPFYTGEDRTLDKTGRVEKFKQRVAAAKSK
jgi:large subunit ribosomal protein L31